jgi:RNA polymerase sigma-70 factor (ECF subfamily)
VSSSGTRTRTSFVEVFTRLMRANPGAGSPLGAAELETELERRIGQGRHAWPAIAVGDEVLLGWLAERTVDGVLPPGQHTSDHYMACACTVGARGALAALERSYFPIVERSVLRIERSRSFVDEATQRLREKLFVSAEDSPARIGDYAGRGPLGAWLCAAAVRTALNLRRRRFDPGAIADDADALVDQVPELEHIKRMYKGEFEEALRTAFAALGERDRALLRLHYANGMTMDDLARMYRVGRSTAHRMVAAARNHLFEITAADLTARLGLSDSEFDSLALALVSRIDGGFLEAIAPD